MKSSMTLSERIQCVACMTISIIVGWGVQIPSEEFTARVLSVSESAEGWSWRLRLDNLGDTEVELAIEASCDCVDFRSTRTSLLPGGHLELSGSTTAEGLASGYTPGLRVVDLTGEVEFLVFVPPLTGVSR